MYVRARVIEGVSSEIKYKEPRGTEEPLKNRRTAEEPWNSRCYWELEVLLGIRGIRNEGNLCVAMWDQASPLEECEERQERTKNRTRKFEEPSKSVLFVGD